MLQLQPVLNSEYQKVRDFFYKGLTNLLNKLTMAVTSALQSILLTKAIDYNIFLPNVANLLGLNIPNNTPKEPGTSSPLMMFNEQQRIQFNAALESIYQTCSNDAVNLTVSQAYEDAKNSYNSFLEG